MPISLTIPVDELYKSLGEDANALLLGESVPVGVDFLEKAQRWITVHPWGDNADGIPVMIEDEGNGKGHVVAGAGGKLNFMRLTNLKSPEQLKTEAKARRRAEKPKKAEKAPKEPTTSEKGHDRRMKFLEEVAPLVGLQNWKADEKKLANLSEGAQKMALHRHYRKVEGEVKKALGEVKKSIVLDLERRHETGLTELPLASRDEDVIALSDLEKAGGGTRGMGYAREVQEKAEARGKPPEQQQFEQLVESGDLDGARQALRGVVEELQEFGTPKAGHEAESLSKVAALPDEKFQSQAAAAHDRGLVRVEAEAVKRERRNQMEKPENALNMEVLMDELRQEARLGASRIEGTPVSRTEKSLTPQEQVDLLKAAKRYEMEMRAIRAEETPDAQERDRRGIAVDFTGEEVDQAVVEDLTNRQMALKNTAFLEEVRHAESVTLEGQPPEPGSMARHYSEGAYNAINRLALNTAGGVLVDRHALDTLGTDATVRALAKRLHETLSPEDLKATVEGLEQFHIDHQARRVEESVREARELLDQAKEIELGTVETPVDLLVAEEMNARRRDTLVKAREILGRSLGEFEATAAMIVALKEKPARTAQTRLGDTATDLAIREARSLGLVQGEDYAIHDPPEGEKTLNLTPSGMDKVVLKPDPERAVLYREMQDIKAGLYDEEKWIPAGMARRVIDPTSIPPLPRLNFDESLDLSAVADPGRVKSALGDYALGRFNDGMSIAAIRKDLTSAEFAVQHGITDDNVQAWLSAVDELLPQVYPSQAAHEATAHLRGPDGKILPGREADHKRLWNESIQKAAQQNQVLDGQIRERLIANSRAFAEREAARTGRAIPPLHDQEIDPTTPETQEAAFRAVAQHPGGVLAFKGVGDLNRADRALLRRHFLGTYGKDLEPSYPKAVGESTPKNPQKDWQAFRTQHGSGTYAEIQKALAAKPKKGLFGSSVNPLATVDLNDPKALAPLVAEETGMSLRAVQEALDHPQYQGQMAGELKQSAQEALRRAWFTDIMHYSPQAYQDYRNRVGIREGSAWENYVAMMGGEREAYRALQEDIRGDVVSEFSRQYAGLAGQSLKTAPVDLSDREKHLKGTQSPEKLRQSLAQEQARRARDLALAANRTQGKFAVGERKERADAIRAALQRTGQRRIFRVAEGNAPEQTPREMGRRYTIGERAEKQLGSVVEQVSKSLPFGKPLKLWSVSLNGKYIMGQRAIKALDRGKRVIFAAGVGTGKTVMALGSFAHLQSQGKVRRALFAVPSIVQGQFAGEAGRYLSPGRYTVHAQPGEDRAARLAAYRNPENHVNVVTHQALRDDALHLMEKHLAMSGESFDRLGRSERAQAVRDAFAKEGIDVQMLVLDEGHDALNRRGKPDSTLAHVLDAISDNVEYYAPMTADPLKNDVSEVFDWLTKLDPKRYPDGSRGEFLARYGNNTAQSREALQREIAPFWYSGRVTLESRARKHVVNLPLSEAQKKAYAGVHALYNQARAARSRGQVDVEALKALSPSSFQGVAPDQVEKTARWLSASLGMLRESALSRVVNTHPGADNVKVQKAVELALEGKKSGKAGVVFAHNLEAVNRLKQGFESSGLRVGVITGASSAKEKDAVKLGFNPEQGQPKYDVLLCSDAGAVGMNAQTGKWLINYDTPDTAKTHNQRIGRIHRIGQDQDVDVYDLVSDTPHETARRKRLDTKYALGEIFQSPLESLDDTGLAHFIAQARAQQHQGIVYPEPSEPALMAAEPSPKRGGA